LLIRKKCSGTGYIMYVFQNILKGRYGQFISPFRSDDEFTAFIGAANDDQRSGLYGLVPGKLLDFLVNNISVFKTNCKNSTGFAL